MTAIITKQNAIDKAFIGGSGGGGDDYPLDATFDTIKVNKEATFTVKDKDITFSNHESRIETLEQAKPVYPTDPTFNTIKVSKDATFTVDDKDITFANHESRIATLEASSGGGGEYPKDATFDSITVNKNANFKIDDKNTVSFANHETRIATLEKSSGGDSFFTSCSGYDYFFVKNENIVNEDYTYNGVDYYKLSVDGIPSTTIDKLKQVNEHLDIFRFTLRKNEIFDKDGNFIKEFYSYVDKKVLYCPVITLFSTEGTSVYKIEYVNVAFTDKPYIAFDQRVPFVPYDLTLSGEISIMYLLPQNTIESTTPEIKCDIITARNAFRLHESNVPYLYKPSIITENDTNYIMKFHIDPSFTIPTNMEFVFREFIFMNNWTLSWTGKEWTGNNIQGRSNGRMKNILNHYCGDNNYVVAVGVTISDFNDFVIKDILHTEIVEKYTLRNVFDGHNPTIGGTYDNGEDFTVKRGDLESLQSMLKVNWDYSFSDAKLYPVFDKYYACPLEIFVNANWRLMDSIKEQYLSHIKEITLTLDIGGGENIYSFKINSSDMIVDTLNPAWGYGLRIIPVNDVADQLNVCVQKSNIDVTDKSVTLYLDRATLKPRPEITWDTSINPFQFIIDQQFYTVSPNPNAATTLYTDFNITSSKIITADNITTMRSDLNVVANTTDVIDADVKALTTKVDKIEVRVTTVEGKVKHLESEVNQIKIEQTVSMVFSIASSLVTYGPKILEIGGNFLRMGKQSIRNLINRFTTTAAGEVNIVRVDAAMNELILDDLDVVTVTVGDTPITTKTDLSKLIAWINEGHMDPKFSDEYATTGEDDCNNPSNMYVSYYTVQDTCMYYRDSLKPAFKLIVDKFDDVADDMKNYVGFNDFISIGSINPDIYCAPLNQSLWIGFSQAPTEGSFDIRVTWADSPSDFNDLRFTVRAMYNAKGERQGYVISSFEIFEGDTSQLNRYKNPYIEADGRIRLDAVPQPDKPDNADMYDNVQLLRSDVKAVIPEKIENIVYKDQLSALNERVIKLEKGNGALTVNPEIEKRLAILEAKCRNITIDGEVSVQSETQTLTIEERLAILEQKCINMKI